MKREITDAPIFVVGSPRSGTSMIQWALREHSHLWGGQESDYLLPLVKSLKEHHSYGSSRGRLHWLSGQKVGWDEFLRHVGYGINSLYTDRAKGLRWVEQTPLYTLMLDDLAVMFPDAVFLWMLRDGREVAHSLQHFEANQQDLPVGTETWRRYTQAALDFNQSTHGDRVFTMRFAEVVTEPESALEPLWEFLAIPSEDGPAQMIRDRKLNSSFATGEEGDRARRGWRSWTAEERHQFASIAGSTMEQFFPDWQTTAEDSV